MPIQRCQQNNEEGWQWGDEGKCYLPSEEGGDDNAKNKAIEQAIAAGASPEELRQIHQPIVNFASLKDVELFRPGVHNDIQFSQAEIDEMIASSNACLPYILQSIEQGEYVGNDKLNAEIKASGKPIPALLNLGHQRYFKDVKDYLKDIRIEFGKAGDWVTANISNVKDDIALMLQEVFNLRSVELIKELFNPLDGNTYRNVIRSIGFLPSHIPPAVSGQNPQLAVEFAQSQGAILVTLYSQTDRQQPLSKETHHMDDIMKGQEGAGVVTSTDSPHSDTGQAKHPDKNMAEYADKLHELESKLVEMQNK